MFSPVSIPRPAEGADIAEATCLEGEARRILLSMMIVVVQTFSRGYSENE